MSRTTRPDWLSSARGFFGGVSSKRRASRNLSPLARLLRIEPLEDRRLLSITVNTLVDEQDGSIVDGDISLRDAIAASPAGGTINFSVTGTINLALGAVVVQDRIIQGPGAAQLTIDAHGASNVFTTRGTSTLSGLTVTGGNGLRGGGIRNESVFGNEGHLTVASSVVTGNTALQGGGIDGGGYTLVYGSVTVVNSTISGNQALAFNQHTQYGQGGGVYTRYADVTVDKSTISGNRADRFGGGIYGGVTMANSTVTGNKAGDLVGFSDGGGIFVRGPLSIVNSTISGNIGSGICFIQGGDGFVANSTVSNNGFGIAAYGGVTLLNTIVAGNGDDNKADITGTVDVSGSRNNLIGSAVNLDPPNAGIGGPPAGGLTNGVNGNIVSVADAGLGPLANNGGPTQTHALFSFSPAVNRGNNSLVPINPSTGLPLAVDQTGATRIFGGGTVDMGAVEFAGTPVPSTVVNTATDDVAGNALTSLREAIGVAAQLGGPVTFDPTVFATPKTISLVYGEISLDGRSAPLVINGPGRALATVDGEDAPVVFKTYGTTTISGLTITGAKFALNPGSAKSYLGAIQNVGMLTISGCAVSDNQTRGIFNDAADAADAPGMVNVVDSIISGNSAPNGAGIYNTDTVNARLISISNSVISGNTATGFGGGLYSNGAVTIENSTISGNSANYGGGIFQSAGAASSLSIANTYIHHNLATGAGGGIRSRDAITLNSTIASNTAGSGGGIYGTGATIINSTISGNMANSGSGGGINVAELVIINSTIANNTASTAGAGGGIDGTKSMVTNSIIVGNTAGGEPSDVVNSVLSPASSYNLMGDVATAGGLTGGVNGNIVNVNPALVLGPLADNGGPTLPGGGKLLTHALVAGSPAFDAGEPTAVAGVGNIPVYDERGAGFTRIIGNAIDMGAFERQTPELTGDYNRNDRVDAADYVVWRKTLSTQFLPNFFGADGDGNGVIGQGDYNVWRAHFGQSLPGAGTGASNAFSQQPTAAPIAEAAPSETGDVTMAASTSVNESGEPEITFAKPAIHSEFVSFVAKDSPRVRPGNGATFASAKRDTLPRDNALLAWLSSSSFHESPPTQDNIGFSWHSCDDATKADGAELDSVDEIFDGLAIRHYLSR